MILTELSETGGYFLSKPAKHSYTLAKALTAQLKAVTSVALLEFPMEGVLGPYWLHTLGFHLLLVTLRSELNPLQFSC